MKKVSERDSVWSFVAGSSEKLQIKNLNLCQDRGAPERKSAVRIGTGKERHTMAAHLSCRE